MTHFDWPALIILTIAAARATHLVTDDDLPFGPLRAWAERRFPNYGWALGCTFCVGLHAGLWATVLATTQDWVPVNGWGDWPIFMIVWFAIGQAVILLEGLVELLIHPDHN